MSTVKDTLFQESDPRSDITLIVEDQKIYLSKAVLSYASPVFDTMFNGDFEEKSKNEISLPEKTYAEFIQFLRCVHPVTLDEITAGNIENVLPLADEYQVEQLKIKCGTFIQRGLRQCCEKTTLNNKDLIHYTMLADKFNLKQPLKTCLDIAVFRTYSNFEKLEDFSKISDATKVDLLSRRLSLIESPAMYMHNDVKKIIKLYESNNQYQSSENVPYDLKQTLHTIKYNKTYTSQLKQAFETD